VETLNRKIARSPFDPENCQRPFKKAQEVRMMVSAVRAMKNSQSKVGEYYMENRGQSSSSIPAYERVKRAISHRITKKKAQESKNKEGYGPEISKEVQVSGDDFTVELIPTHNSPLFKEIRTVK
jgi:hypothetical protein